MDKQDITIVSTKEFEDWLRSIVDVSSRRKIILRIQSDKDSQKKDITKAQQIWQEVKDDIEKL